MRALAPLLAFLVGGCHGGSRSSDSATRESVVRMDSATARRICESPDSVIAGTKECVLLNQGLLPDARRARPTPRE